MPAELLFEFIAELIFGLVGEIRNPKTGAPLIDIKIGEEAARPGAVHVMRLLRYPYMFIALFFPVIGIVLIVYPAFFEVLNQTVWLIFIWGFTLFALLLIPLLSVNIRYDAYGFKYRNVLWIKRKYTYREIREVREWGNNKAMYTLVMRDGRRIRLFNLYIGLPAFKEAVRLALSNGDAQAEYSMETSNKSGE